MKPYLTAPMIVDFNITRRCNLNCKYCYADAGDIGNEYELSLDEIKSILKELAEMNVQIIRISGGEPLVRKEYIKIVEYCEDLGLLVCTNTNGTLITQEIIDCFKKNCIKRIGISLDSYMPHIHNQLRGEPFAFKKTTDGIKKLIEAGLSQKITIVITLSNLNATIDEIKNYLEYLGSLKIRYVSFQYAVSVGRGDRFSDCTPEYDKWKKIIVWLYSNINVYKEKYNIEYVINITNESECKFELFYPFIEGKRIDLLESVEGAVSEKADDYISCQAGNTTIAITADGKVYPCELMMCYKELEAGDLRRDTFKEVWSNSKILKEIRNMKMDDLEGECNNCSMRLVCGGGCRAAAYAYSHNIKACDRRCPKVEESLNLFIEKINIKGHDVIVRKEHDGYYFPNPVTLKMYHLNKIGYRILKSVTEVRNKEDIKNCLVVQYGLSQDSVEETYEKFVLYLKTENLI